MSETAAYLVDYVLPAVPTRQWVLSLSFPLRYRLAYDRTLARRFSLRSCERCLHR